MDIIMLYSLAQSVMKQAVKRDFSCFSADYFSSFPEQNNAACPFPDT